MDNQSTMQFGVHYMLDGYGANEDALADEKKLRAMLEKLPSEVGMHAISEPSVVNVGPKNMKDPGGYSGFILVAESHISFHTFPKRGFVSIDIYTCQDHLNTKMLTDKFVEVFGLKEYEEHPLIKRGANYPTENIY